MSRDTSNTPKKAWSKPTLLRADVKAVTSTTGGGGCDKNCTAPGQTGMS